MNTKRDYRSFDFILVILVISLAILGIILIGSAKGLGTIAPGAKLPQEFSGQIIWVGTGILIMIAAALIDFQFICKFYIPIYVLNIVLLVFVLIYGHFLSPEDLDVYRSIYLPGNIGSIQPSEFNKIFMIIFLAKYMDKHKEKINRIGFLASVAAMTALPVFLIMLEPSLSASLVTVVIMTVMLFVAKIHYRYILIALAVVVPLAAAIAYDVGNAIVTRVPHNVEIDVEVEVNGETEIRKETKTEISIQVTYNENSMSPILIDKILSPYQISRLKSFADPQEDEDASYQNNQALLALGSGQLSGKGLFEGEVFVPEAANDFIFTVLGEEFGFVGCVTVIAVIFIIVFRCIVIATRSDIFYGKLIAAAVGGMLTFQTFCNVGVNAGLLPNTGMIFPFISAGGSAMWVFMALIGMVISIGMTKMKPMFAD